MNSFINPLEAVQLIPIFGYLNALSEFLIITNYLPENDHNKQIPAVNALYQYLHDNRNNKSQNIELIRNLLKRSDLYGSRDDEYIDITFANTMIEHIITSLVFNKFGNIYGFLANTFLEAEDLEVDQVLKLFKINLKKLSFENEYGENSQLTSLAIDRIYNDIITPLFPPGKNINLLSHDYIYAQAALIFLRAGKTNTVYYAEAKYLEPEQETFIFDEHLITGYLIENFLLTKKMNYKMIKAFALPALTYYIFNSKYLFTFREIANIISETEFWKKAYEQLFQYLMKFYQNMKFKYQNVYIPKIYLSTFQKRDHLDFNQENCANLQRKNKTNSGLSLYFYYTASYQCKADHSLNYHASEIKDIISLYEIQDLQLLKNAFTKSLMETFENAKLLIKLIIPSNIKEYDDLFETEDLPYDIFEFYYPDTVTFDYYLLKRDKYKLILSNEGRLFTSSTLILLKKANETMVNFFHNLIEYKKSRLEEYLKTQDQTEGNKEEIKTNWWEEFGLSPVVYYPCQSTETPVENICEADQIKYTDNCQKYLCKTIKSLIYKRTVIKSVGDNVSESFTKINVFNDSIFEDISIHLSNPDFQLNFIKTNGINEMKRIICELKEQTNFNFTFLSNYLLRMTILKSTNFHKIDTIKETNQPIYVNTLLNRPNTGYGYKFIFISDDGPDTAILRTGHEFQDLRFFILYEKNRKTKKYIALNNLTLNVQDDYTMYEINNRLFKRPNKFLFSQIPIPPDDYDAHCSIAEYYSTWKSSRCQRLGRFYQHSQDIKQATEFIKKKTTLCEKTIKDMLQKYIFPNIEKVTKFVKDYLENNSLTEPDWSKEYLVNNCQLLHKVRYDSQFETHGLTTFEGKLRINSFYSSAERREIEKEVPLATIVKNYNEKFARYSLTFHDYYAIRNYIATGYRRIGANTKEAKLMKIALYTLAIRQSDDQNREFNSRFRIETVPFQIFRILSEQKNITLQKFTQTSSSVSSAMKYAGYPALGYVNIIYEMVFSGVYVNVRIEQVYKNTEENVILLPGSEFDVEDTEWLQLGGLGKIFKFKLKFRHFVNEKIMWYRKIMNAIENIDL